MEETSTDQEKRKFILSLIFPLFFIFLIWMVKIVEVGLELDFTSYGIYPHKLKGIFGIITAPFIHADFSHLINNSIPLFILSAGIFYFYSPIAYRVFFLTWIITGVWVWLSAREAYHIGASGLIYGFAFFLFFSGVFRKDVRLMAISILVVFLYGSIVWGIFPFFVQISWESHLMGAVAGLFLAIIYRKYGPQRKRYDWELEEDEENDEDNDYTKASGYIFPEED